MHAISDASDIPSSDVGDLCPLFEQRTYTINNYKLDTDKFPRILQSGVYRLVLIMRNSTEAITGQLTLIMVLT